MLQLCTSLCPVLQSKTPLMCASALHLTLCHLWMPVCMSMQGLSPANTWSWQGLRDVVRPA